MCGDCFKIKVCNKFASNNVAVKCGVCPVCRKIEQNSWIFRLRAELESKHRDGWKIGFCTLTYSDEYLPHIPVQLIDVTRTTVISDDQFPCFCRRQVVDFVKQIRKYLYDHTSIGHNKDGIRYLIAAEYGSTTQRPHYHAVFCWPPEVDADYFYSLIKSKWTFGFVFPENVLGGVDSHGYEHKPFEVTTNPSGVAKYIAKYVCKDLNFFDSLSAFYPVEGADLSDYFPFHIQSKALGFSRLKDLSDDERLSMLKDGLFFAGDDKPTPLPLYFRNKLIFDNQYIVERSVFQGTRKVDCPDDSLSDAALESLGFRVEYRRLVRRKANDFFKQHYEFLYSLKVKAYTKFFDDAFNFDKLLAIGVERRDARFISSFMKGTDFESPEYLANLYLTYFGVPHDRCYDIEPATQWFLRFTDDFDTSSFPFFTIDRDFWEDVQYFVKMALYLALDIKIVQSEYDELVERIRDFFKSAV